MPELRIHPDGGREAPGYALERRLARLKGLPAERRRKAHQGLLESSVLETLRLTGAAPLEKVEKDRQGPLFDGALEALVLIEMNASSGKELDLRLIREVHRLSSPPSGGEIRSAHLA